MYRLQLPYLDVSVHHFITVILQSNCSFSEGAECFPFLEFATGNQFLPAVSIHCGLNRSSSIQLECERIFVLDDLSCVPLACRFYHFSRAGNKIIKITGAVLWNFCI